MIVRLQLSPKEHVQTMLLIAGIRAPSTKRMNPSDKQEQPAEPYGDEAQQFVEVRLLQRNVVVTVLGLSPQNQIVGSVKHPSQGTIAPHILKAGFARCTDFHSTLLGSDMGELRQAEKAARDGKQGLFKGVAAAQKAGSENDAVVSRILSADTIFLRNNKTGTERRINLSSVRQPKPSDPKQAPWQAEAKEFLRKRAIGKHVKFQINGKRAATEGFEEREMATVTLAGKNVGLLLVESGFASVIRHRADDTDRSPIYDDLLLAEQEAQTSKKGMWSDKANAAKQYVDHSETLEKAKRQMALLSRQKKVAAVVDFVKSASRFTVLIPKDNAKLTFVLSGIRAPRSARNATDQGEPFGKEAHEFANKRLQQRDVEIDVEDVDKVGGFIGALFVNRENFAKLLLEEGYASVHAYSAEKSGNGPELFAAEKKAKEGRKGLWHDWDPSQDDEAEDAGYTNGGSNGHAAAETTAAPRKSDYRDVVVTHVDESGHLKVQQIGKGTAALEDLMSSFRKFHLSAKPLDQPPKVGEVVSAKFMGDWYRAKIRRNDREKKRAEVVYFDYGNSEFVDWKDLRGLPQEKFGSQVLKPQAVDATLSYIQLPSGQYLADTISFLQNEVQDRVLVASVDFQEKDGSLSVTLYDPKASEKAEDSINAELVLEGLAMVPRKTKAWERGAEIFTVLKKKEKEAKDEHRGTWEYGDVLPDEDLEPLRK
jgi:staphylococcal nuclease domain-containing protein 1